MISVSSTISWMKMSVLVVRGWQKNAPCEKKSENLFEAEALLMVFNQ